MILLYCMASSLHEKQVYPKGISLYSSKRTLLKGSELWDPVWFCTHKNKAVVRLTIKMYCVSPKLRCKSLLPHTVLTPSDPLLSLSKPFIIKPILFWGSCYGNGGNGATHQAEGLPFWAGFSALSQLQVLGEQ